MAWNKLTIQTTEQYADAVSDQLMLLGASAITFQDAGDEPIYEPLPGTLNFWQTTNVSGLFAETEPLAPILTYFEQQQSAGLIKHFVLENLPDQVWERTCLAHVQPLQFGQRLWICPSWETPCADPASATVILDPGLAFGTGTHPTTALCLTWLAQHIQTQALVIDYGCGSGILGLAALKLGAKQVLAIDHDPQALLATEQNAIRNQLQAPALRTALADQLPALPKRANLLIANILAQPLIDLAPHFATLLQPDGQLLLSGILREQIPAIEAAYAPWFTFQPPVIQAEWVLLIGNYK